MFGRKIKEHTSKIIKYLAQEKMENMIAYFQRARYKGSADCTCCDSSTQWILTRTIKLTKPAQPCDGSDP